MSDQLVLESDWNYKYVYYVFFMLNDGHSKCQCGDSKNMTIVIKSTVSKTFVKKKKNKQTK